VTGPSPVYLPQYKRWAKEKKLDPAMELKNVITDHYFRLSDGGKNKAALHKARTMSWALTYYLAKKHLPELMEYYRELSRLPRNLEFDERVLLRTFGKAFKLMDPDNPTEISQKLLADTAERWHRDTLDLTLEPFEEQVLDMVRKYEFDPEATTKATPTTPAGGGNRGGPGGGPLGGPGGGGPGGPGPVPPGAPGRPG
jgi:hypothetical protein